MFAFPFLIALPACSSFSATACPNAKQHKVLDISWSVCQNQWKFEPVPMPLGLAVSYVHAAYENLVTFNPFDIYSHYMETHGTFTVKA